MTNAIRAGLVSGTIGLSDTRGEEGRADEISIGPLCVLRIFLSECVRYILVLTISDSDRLGFILENKRANVFGKNDFNTRSRFLIREF